MSVVLLSKYIYKQIQNKVTHAEVPVFDFKLALTNCEHHGRHVTPTLNGVDLPERVLATPNAVTFIDRFWPHFQDAGNGTAWLPATEYRQAAPFLSRMWLDALEIWEEEEEFYEMEAKVLAEFQAGENQ